MSAPDHDPEQPAVDEAAASSASSRPGVFDSIWILLSASRGYWLVNLANFGDGVAYFGMLALMTLFLEHNLQFTANWSTLSISLYTGAVTVFMALGGGVLSDRLGVRSALTLCIATLLIGRILFTLAPEGGGFVTAATLAGLGLLLIAAGEGVLQPALYSGIKEYTDQRTATLGYAFLYSIMNLGIVAGEVVSPLVREAWAARVDQVDVAQNPTAGISGAFWFFIAVTAVMLAVNVLLFTKRVERRDRKVIDEVTAPEPAAECPQCGTSAAQTGRYCAQCGARRAGRFNWSDYFKKLPILDRRFLFFIFILLPVRTLFAHQWLTMPGYVTRAFPAEVGARWEWINGLNPLVIVIFVPLIAMMTQKRRVVDMMIVGTAVSAAATFMLVGEANTWMLLAYVVVFSLGEAAWSSRFLEYVADIAPVNRVGIYMGIAGIPWFLAKMTTGFYAGSMLDHFVPEQGVQDPGQMWLWYGIIALVTPIGLIAARKWLITGVDAELEPRGA